MSGVISRIFSDLFQPQQFSNANGNWLFMPDRYWQKKNASVKARRLQFYKLRTSLFAGFVPEVHEV